MRLRPLAKSCLTVICTPLVLTCPSVFAQTPQQKVTPPIAVYWVSAETSGGMAGLPGGGAAGVLGGLFGGGAASGLQGGRSMLLQLGSSQGASGEPRAAHEIPPGMNMGPSLPLLTPRQAPREPREPGEDTPENFEKPKGRMLIYWGCGDAARTGQPIVIDFAKIAAGQIPKFPTVRVAAGRAPSFSRSKTYGDWPNTETRTQVPANASLRGDHLVKGSYSPEIRFSVTDRTDFMQAPSFQPARSTPAGGMSVQWQSIPNATGYFLAAMGQNQRTQDMIIWSSSEVADMGWALNTWLPPSEVARLIKDRVVLAPSTTECTVPPEVVKQAERPMVTFVGYGDELNVVHPPRPTDVKVPWEQIYAVKVRQRTSAMLLLAEGQGGSSLGQGPSDAGSSGGESPQTQRPAATPTVQDVIKEGVGGVLRGLFGR
jgi:hypothetical protein